MNWEEFAEWGGIAANWGAQYHASLRDESVFSKVKPGETSAKLATSPPESGDTIEEIWRDFLQVVMPGITHWQHPRFFAYFNANASPASALAEFLAAMVAPNCMLWQTSPSATEMETRMMEWLLEAVALPNSYQGVIQDSASSATLAAVLTMRERALNWRGNQQGLQQQRPLRIYCSDQVHSSIDRAIWIAGIGQENLVKISAKGPQGSMCVDALQAAIAADRERGYLPIGIIAVTGATSTGASDDLCAVTTIAEKENLYSHLDAAWAGSAMICPEFRYLWEGAERFDSIVFNPHKWLGVQFDCSAHFLKDASQLNKTLAIRPDYLKTANSDEVINYSEYSIPLGRRFRALKLWFVLRCYGLEVLRTRIRNHVNWSQALCNRLRAEKDFEIVTEPILSIWTFRVRNARDEDMLKLVETINTDGRISLTSTRVDDRTVIRFQAGTFDCTEADFDIGFAAITELGRTLCAPAS